MSGPRVRWAQKIGFLGEALIALRLSRIALVSRYDKDIGIDFYCETLFEEVPGTSFYVQAKGTEHFDEESGTQIPKSTIIYWLERPSPVYLFVGDIKREITYWVSIEEKREWLNEKLSSETDSVYFKFDTTNELNKENFEDFGKQLRSDITSFQTNLGIPPVIGTGYVRAIPKLDLSSTQRQVIFDRARMSLMHLILATMNDKNYKTAKEMIEGLIKLGSTHAINYLLLGQSWGELGEPEESLSNYKIALGKINDDDDYLASPLGQAQKAYCEKKIKELTSKESGPARGKK